MTPKQLRCEYLKNPLGIGTVEPRFSWILESDARGVSQSSYQILVADSEEKLDDDVGNKWDSCRVESDNTVHTAHDGVELTSTERCWWKVRAWDQEGNIGEFSEPAWFEMGLLKNDDWSATWIGADEEISAPLLRKEFSLGKAVDRARAYVSGLGYYELHINDERVGDHVLDPASTSYNDCDQPIVSKGRVLYVTHDVTDMLRTGANAIGAMVGNGWYGNDYPETGWRRAYGDRPILLLQLNVEYADGTHERIVSDGTWKASPGPITSNDIYHGEEYDARLEKDGWTSPGYDDSDWDSATAVDPPGGVLSAQMLPPIKVMETIKPVALTKPADGVYIFDMGKHFTGWVRLRVSGDRGLYVMMRHAGVLHENGTLDTKHNWRARQTDMYTLRGGGEEVWEPRFIFHGFRYVEITGYPGVPTLDSIKGRVVRTAVEQSGHFECSNDLVNRVHGIIVQTFANSHQGLPQDACDRCERVAWLGDPGFIIRDLMLNFGDASFWSKWLIDIRDTQKTDGQIPTISPFHSPTDALWYKCPAWYCTYPLIMWHLYEYSGDEQVLGEHYDGVRRLVEHFNDNANEHIVRYGLGDHMEPQYGSDPPTSSFSPQHTPASLTSTAYYYIDTVILVRAAQILGKLDDAERYDGLAESIRDAFDKEFFDEETGQYATGSQTSNALPLLLGMVPEDRRESVAKNVADDVLLKHDGHMTTGIIGTSALARVLPSYGYADVMYGILTKTTFPSYGYTISLGATSLWECFEGHNLSLDMKMFGGVDNFFYKSLAGIRSGAPGYRHVIVEPHVVGDLSYARASIGTVRGVVAAGWELKDTGFVMNVTIPANATAKIHVPTRGMESVVIEESGQAAWKDGSYMPGVDGIRDGKESGEYVTFYIGSGSYAFALNYA